MLMKLSTSTPSLLLLFILTIAIAIANSQAIAAGEKKSPVSAVFAFGDSTVDTGNNNYILTPLKSNFFPYGKDFLNHLPTGRFTNGKLIPDFVVSYLGIKEVLPPYLDWSLGEEELVTGVSFGSAGSGLDPLTASLSAVIPVLNQLDYFRNYINRLDQMVGEKRRQDIIKNAVFLLSFGTNDFITYSTVLLRREVFSVEGYQSFLLAKVKEFIQGLSEFGAMRIVVSGLPPMGCLPIVITLKASDGIHERECINSLNSIALDYNMKLQAILHEHSSSSAAQMFYVDPYKPLLDIITSPTSYGFNKSSEGCCGTGLVEAAVLCNMKSLICADASKYVFWDSVHPTEKAYFITFSSFKPVIEQILKSY